MAATGKYQVIEAQTLEMREHHRLLLEQKLNDPHLPPELRAELQHDLSHAVNDEINARYDLLKAEEEEERRKGKGEGSEGGEEGGQQGSGGQRHRQDRPGSRQVRHGYHGRGQAAQ